MYYLITLMNCIYTLLSYGLQETLIQYYTIISKCRLLVSVQSQMLDIIVMQFK